MGIQESAGIHAQWPQRVPGHEQKEAGLQRIWTPLMVRSTGMFALEIPDILVNSCYIAVCSATSNKRVFRCFKDDCTIRIHEEHYRWERQ